MSLEDIKQRAEAASVGPWSTSRAANADGQDLSTTKAEKAEFLYLSLNDSGSDLWLLTNDEVIPAVTGDGPNAKANAEFIAHARTDIPKLVAALDALTKLHYQREDAEDVIPWSCMDGPCEHDDDCPEVEVKGCDECSTPEYIVQWPCPTVRAITEALA